MTTRTRKAPATTPAPAKKATQRKAAAKKTAAAKRGTGKVTEPKPAPAPVSQVKPDTEDVSTQVDTRPMFAVRRKYFTGPMGVTEQAAVQAALAAASLALPIPVRTWNGSTAQLADGLLLIHNPSPDRTFTAHIACRHGAIHNWPINSHTDLREARALTHACERRHSTPTTDGTELDWDKAITRGVGTVAQPKPSAVLQLREGIRRAEATKADTQPLDTSEIAANLAARADHDQMKEHPQP